MNPFGVSPLITNRDGGHQNVWIHHRTGGLVIGIAMLFGRLGTGCNCFTLHRHGRFVVGGVLSTTDGAQEPLRCRASYDVAGRGDQLRLNLRCASDSYSFDLASDVEYRDGMISGSWSEASRNASGTISGRAAGDHVEAAARGESFSANLSLTTRGHPQTASIRPQGTNITAVSLALNRR